MTTLASDRMPSAMTGLATLTDRQSSAPATPRKNIQGLPPTYLHHLRCLLHQFLSQQLAPPDEGLPGPSNRNKVPDRLLWSPERLAEIEQAIWGVVLKDAGGGKEGLLGCDWDQWTAGAKLRKDVWKQERPVLDQVKSAAEGVPGGLEGTVKGLGLRLPVAVLLPSALTSATSTPTKGDRSPSVASSIRSRSRDRGIETEDLQGVSPAPDRVHPEPIDALEEWCRQIRSLKGFRSLKESQKEGWEVVQERVPHKAPIQEIPGAFPQAFSSYANSVYSAQSLVSLDTPTRQSDLEGPLPSLLKPVISLSFISPPQAFTSGSARSQSTLRFAREGSVEPHGESTRSRHGSVSGPSGAVGAGSGGLGGLGGWFGNKWSEMTASPEDGKVEMEFVPGRFALPKTEGGVVRRRSSTIKRRRKDSSTSGNEDNDSNDGDDSETDNDDTVDSHDSTWSGTERGHGGRTDGDISENVVVAGAGVDIPVGAAGRGEVGIVGGTIVIRGVKREEERRSLERVFRAIIYTIQSNTFELSLLDAFSVPRQPDPVLPPRLPPKPEPKRTRTTANVPRPSSPNLNRANSHGSGNRKGFFAKLGLGSSEGGKAVRRGMWDGIMGKRRASQLAQPDHGLSEDEVDDDLVLGRGPSINRMRSTSVSQSQGGSPYHAPQMQHPYPHHMGGIDRHLHLLAHISGMLHSTTPGLVFPLPAILLRVHEEDRIRRDKASEEMKVEYGGSAASTAVQALTSGAPPGLRRTGTITAWRGGSTASDATTGSVASNGTGIDGLPLGMPLSIPPRVDDTKGRALGYRLGGDIRSGLASLAGNLEGWDGWCRLQRIEYIFWMGVEDMHEEKVKEKRTILACTKPLGSAHRFYDPTSDMSIEDYLAELADELGISGVTGACKGLEDLTQSSHLEASDKQDGTATSKEKEEDAEGDQHLSDESGSWEPVCGRPGCGVAERDHLRIWATGGRRVVGRILKTHNASAGDREDGSPFNIQAQVSCDTCGATSGWRMMGIVQGMSWNKLLELILYSSLLLPPSLCSHSSHASRPTAGATPAATFTYVLSSPSLTLRLTSESQPVLDTRLPKLQVGPLVAKRKMGSEAAKAASESFVSAASRGPGGPAGKSVPGELVKAWRVEVEKWAANLECSGPARTSLDAIVADITTTAEELLATDVASDANQRITRTKTKLDNIQQQLEVWRSAHMPALPKSEVSIPAIPDLSAVDDAGMKFPGGSVLVRIDEPASVIAYTLSSLAYFNELCGGTSAKSTASTATSGIDPTPLPISPPQKLDDQWKIEVSRRDNPREILPLRALTKKRSEMSFPSTARLPLSVTPNAPSLELNLQPVTGHSGVREGGGIDDLVKSISRAAGQDPVLTTSINPMLTPSVMLPRPHSTEPSPASLAIPPSASSLSLSESELSTNQEKKQAPRLRRRLPDDAPPSSYRRTVSASVSASSSPRSTPTPTLGSSTPPRSTRDKENQATIHPSPGLTATSSLAGHDRYASTDRESWGGSVTSSFASSFNTLLKLGTDVTDSLTSRVRPTPGDPQRSLASIMNPLNHSSADHQNPDDSRPHIQIDLTHPEYKISCTVYFASAFDTLRRRCAFDRSFVRSLERSMGWMAEGGKSKANFWKTEDGRLVVKSLVTKWNVSDLQALIDIAPAYFEHMATTHNKATALAKIVGFYNVKIHDVKTNEKQSMDLLVMENLFWKQEIDRTFDLKGIEARRVPKGKDSGSTLFDGEWLDGQATSPLFVQPHAKRILLDSLTTDTRFLSSQHIVDYSLLLGLDRAHSELVVGVVDAVGSYGLFKNIESMGKIALNRGREGDVTIVCFSDSF